MIDFIECAWCMLRRRLYSQTRAVVAVRDLFKVSPNRVTSFQPKDAIFPARNAPVVRKAIDGEWELLELSWGFVLPQRDKAPRRATNVCLESIDSRFWQESFRLRRCLVPATSFSEPNTHASPVTWAWFARVGEHKRPPFAFAGIWRSWRGPIKKDGSSVDLDVFSFFTTTPNRVVAQVNYERMPVILDIPADRLSWLEAPAEEAQQLLRPYPDTQLTCVQDTKEKKDLEIA